MRARRLLPLLLAMLLAGCAGLPSSSSVQARLPIDSPTERSGVVVQPEPPAVGATPEQIAEGFLQAHIGLDDDFAVARQFLTTAAGSSWQPDQGITILRSYNLTARRSAPGTVTVSGTAQGRVDAEGHVRQLPGDQRVSLQLSVTQEHGAWRISGVPHDLGLWLSSADFNRLYYPRNVYFATSNGPKVLVPDVRWLPDSGVATALARAVLGPPPVWLAPVVRHDLPSGTKLQVDSVPISDQDSVATVDLSRQVLRASPADREALWASMLQTLNQAPGVRRVELTVGGARLEAPGLAQEPVSADELDYSVVTSSNGRVIVRDKGRLSWASDSGSRPVRGAREPNPAEAKLPSIGSQWYLLAADTSGREIAGISGDRRTLGRWVGGKQFSRPSFGRQLTRPSFDGFSGLWVAGQALTSSGPQHEPGTEPGPGTPPERAPGPPTIWVIDTSQPLQQAQPQAIPAPWLGNRDIVAISVSPEGQRLAVVVRDRKTAQTTLLLTGVGRDQRGQVDQLSTPETVSDAVVGLQDVTWADDSTLAVLGQLRTQPGVTQPVTVPLSGMATGLGAAPGAVSLVGGSSQGGIFVVTSRGTILSQQGRSWQAFAEGQDLMVPAS